MTTSFVKPFYAVTWAHELWNPWLSDPWLSAAKNHFHFTKLLQNSIGASLIEPEKWAKRTRGRSQIRDGSMRRVLVGPHCNPFDLSADQHVRSTFWQTLRLCSDVNWLLVGHSFDAIAKALPDDWHDGYPNVWIGVRASSEPTAARALAVLKDVPSQVRFLLLEPLLGDLGDLDLSFLDWLVFEEGADESVETEEWFTSVRLQAMAYGVPVWSSRHGLNSELCGTPCK
jgi:protein gp37